MHGKNMAIHKERELNQINQFLVLVFNAHHIHIVVRRKNAEH